MGEAKRRGGHSPTAVERVTRWINRMWLLYPRPVRTFYRVNAEIVGIVLVVLIAAGILAYSAQWLMHR